MPCTQIAPGMIVCAGHGRRAPCIYCRRPHERLCDFSIALGKTCDRKLCAGHAHRVAPDRDLCPDHVSAGVKPESAASQLWVFTGSIHHHRGDSDALDITAMTGGAAGRPFAPSMALLRPALAARRRAKELREQGAEEAAAAVETQATDGRFLTVKDLDANPWASCGPAALAALLGCGLEDVRRGFPEHRPDRTWTNLVQMRRALDALGLRWHQTEADPEARVPEGHYQAEPVRRWPALGIVQVFFRGPWEAQEAFPMTEQGHRRRAGAALARSHWVAVKPAPRHRGARQDLFDVNALCVDALDACGGWQPRGVWERLMAPELARLHRRSTGDWWVRAGIEVDIGAGRRARR